MKADIILGVLQGQYELAKEAFLADPEACDFVLQWARERDSAPGRYRVEAVRQDGDQFILTLTDLNMAGMRESAIEANASGEMHIPLPVPPDSLVTRESVIDFYAIFRHMVLNLTEGVT